MSDRHSDRQSRMRPLAATLPAVTRAALGKRGMALAALLSEWEAIMGPALAGATQPIRLVRARAQGHETAEDSGAVLELRAWGAAAVEVQHLEPRLIERINAHFGYRAVKRLKLRQGPPAGARLRQDSAVPPIRPPGAAEERALFRQLEGVGDESLRDALAGLGRAVAGKAR
ncbi:MAG: DUF721 domain-containing protein [Rhodospirillales bacterium]